jgi:hypothetical protein
MAEDKIVRLVRLLLEKTKAGEIRWEETIDPNTFQCSLINYSVLISQRSVSGMPGLTEPMRSLRICNEEGKTIEEVTDAVPSLLGGVELKELFEVVRRDAMGLEKALDEMLHLLETGESKS